MQPTIRFWVRNAIATIRAANGWLRESPASFCMISSRRFPRIVQRCWGDDRRGNRSIEQDGKRVRLALPDAAHDRGARLRRIPADVGETVEQRADGRLDLLACDMLAEAGVRAGGERH